jgi:hypothetical protein
MKFRDVEKIQTLSRLEFADYMRRPTAPLVLTGAMRDWPAMEKWSLDFFSGAFPDFPVMAHAPQFPGLAICSVKTTLADYVDYLRDPTKGRIKGQWTKGNPEILLKSGLTLYAGNFNPAHPIYGNRDLLFNYVPALPDFIECWRSLLDPDFSSECEALQSHYFVYLSAQGGVTPLHDDFWDTHAFLAQISGRKEAFLFHPDNMPLLYSEPSGNVRQMMKARKFANVEGWRATLSPGDMLILPSRWLHYVETAETSITYSADWIDGSNWRSYVAQAKQALVEHSGAVA